MESCLKLCHLKELNNFQTLLKKKLKKQVEALNSESLLERNATNHRVSSLFLVKRSLSENKRCQDHLYLSFLIDCDEKVL